MQNIEKNLIKVRNNIAHLARRYRRDPEDISLLAVSKKKSAQDIRTAYAALQFNFGENYLQEARQKMLELSDLEITWHFIGAIQSNKTRIIAEHFDWAHCIDRLKIAQRLNEQRPDSMAPINVCIQVNIDSETSKSGVSLEQVASLAEQIKQLPRVRLRGLMAIPAPYEELESQREPFARLRHELTLLNQNGLDCNTLSIGMSHDMEAAIAEGSTLVRIGTAIFGERF
ncbi:MAG: YggS family pyridoxal phosphate-dependent enzyme [Gammaproteobacteria bacterium]|nr:MAG: YggS family pyridoxal phosphate-dependent enzyme [Gammaproteobacteria bacterium]